MLFKTERPFIDNDISRSEHWDQRKNNTRVCVRSLNMLQNNSAAAIK